MVIGAWALGVHGQPRATRDLDFMVAAVDADLERLGATLEEQIGLARHNPMLEGLQIRLTCGDMTVDVLAPRDEQDRSALRRRRRVKTSGGDFWCTSAEDFVLQKIKVGRALDMEDAFSVLKRRAADVDRAYRHDWAGRLGLAVELDHLLSRLEGA